MSREELEEGEVPIEEYDLTSPKKLIKISDDSSSSSS